MRRHRSQNNRRRLSAYRKATLAAFGLLLLAVLLPLPALPARAQRADGLVMIIAASTRVQDMPSDVLRAAFLGLRSEYQGVRLVPINLPLRTHVRERLDLVLLGLAPTEVGSFWVDQRVRDGRTPPRTAPSAEVAVRVVAQLPGAIACVPASIISPDVRALRIDGKTPAESSYLLLRE